MGGNQGCPRVHSEQLVEEEAKEEKGELLAKLGAASCLHTKTFLTASASIRQWPGSVRIPLS